MAKYWRENFNRANSDTVGNGWSETNPSANDMVISGNALYCGTDGNETDGGASYRARESGFGRTNTTVMWKWQKPSNSDAPSEWDTVGVSHDGTRASATSGICCTFSNGSNSVKVNDGATEKGSGSFTFSTDTWYYFVWDIESDGSMKVYVSSSGYSRDVSDEVISVSAFTPASTDNGNWCLTGRYIAVFDEVIFFDESQSGGYTSPPVVLYKSEGGSTTGTSRTVNKPSGTVEGQLMVAFIFYHIAGINSVPSGWTEMGSTITAGNEHLNVYYKKAGASEPSSWNWGFTTTVDNGYVVLTIDGHDADTPFDTSASDVVNNDTTPSYANGITPRDVDSLLLLGAVAGDSITGMSAYAITTSNPANWMEEADNGNRSYIDWAVASAPRPESTATGNSSLTLDGGGGTEDSGARLIAIASQPASTPVTVSPSVQSATLAVQSPTVAISKSVSPSAQAVTAGVQAPTLALGTGVSITPSVQTVTASTQAPAVSGGKIVQPSAQGVTASVQAPTIAVESLVTVTPSAQIITFATPAPTIDIGTAVTHTPSVLGLVIGTPTTTVLKGIQIEIESALALTLSMPADTIDADFWQDPYATGKPSDDASFWSDKY